MRTSTMRPLGLKAVNSKSLQKPRAWRPCDTVTVCAIKYERNAPLGTKSYKIMCKTN
jgi:hypothetical protein